MLAVDLRSRPRWRAFALPTLLVVLLAAPAFAVKGVAFYGFLVLILGWFVQTATWFRHVTRNEA